MPKTTSKEFRETAEELACVLQSDSRNCSRDSDEEILMYRTCADYLLKLTAKLIRQICNAQKIDK